MQDFANAYGLWILIGLLAVAVLFFLFNGSKNGDGKAVVPPSAKASSDADQPVAVEPIVLVDPTGAMGIVPLVEPTLAPAHKPDVIAEKPAAKAEVAAKPKTAPKPKPAPALKAEPKPAKTAPAPKAAPPAKAAPKAAPVTKAAPKPKPAAKAAPKPKAAAPAVPDDLLLIKGVGPKVNAILIAQGVTRFDQIAAWKKTDIDAIDEQLGTFAGRPEREHWVDQAKLLAKGDTAGFEAKYGKI